jgi:hypothetical protein
MRTQFNLERHADGSLYFTCPMCGSPHTYDELQPRAYAEYHNVTEYVVTCQFCTWKTGFHVEAHEAGPVYAGKANHVPRSDTSV